MAKRCVCGAVMEDDMIFCTECGKKLEATVPAAKEDSCPRCGAAVEPGDVFCTSCGCDLRPGGETFAPKIAKAVAPGPESGDRTGRSHVIIGRMEKPDPDIGMDEHFHVPGDL